MISPATQKLLAERKEARDEAVGAFEDAVVLAYEKGASLGEISRACGWNHTAAGRMLERLGVRKRWRNIRDMERELTRLQRLVDDQDAAGK